MPPKRGRPVKNSKKRERILNVQEDNEVEKNSEIKGEENINRKLPRDIQKKETTTDDKYNSPGDIKKARRKQQVPIKRKLETKKEEEDGNDNKDNKDDQVPSKKLKIEKKMVNPTETDFESINYDCHKIDGKCKKYNLKISSWNVSGIRALINKNGMEYFIRENADIIAIQETKCDTKKLPREIELPGYKHYYLDSEKSGYCGVALYFKNGREPIEIKYGLNNSEMDKEGRVITAEFNNFYLINVYVPNSGRKLVSMSKRLKWNDIFKEYVKALDAKKPVIVCGDMNVAHQEIDLANPKANTKNAGFTKEERDGMTDFLAAGFIDTYRHLYPEKTGAYTFWSYFANSRKKNIGWRLDYFIISKSIKDNICDNIIRSSVNGSDHCPIVLFVTI